MCIRDRQPGSREQGALLAVVDYNDQIMEGVHLYNLCVHCGLAMGGKLWWNREEGTDYCPSVFWAKDANEEAFKKKTSKYKSGMAYWRCLLEWKQLQEAMEWEKENIRPGERRMWATEMWDHNVKTFGEDWRKWPVPGCGKAFSPYKFGPSMVLIIDSGDGKMMSIQAARPPTLIDDALKSACVKNVKRYVKDLDLKLIWRFLPTAYPLDSAYAHDDVWSGKKYLGVNKYPLDQWKQSKRPYLDETGWLVFSLILAAGNVDPTMLRLANIAIGMYDRDPKTVEYNAQKSEKKLLYSAWEKEKMGIKIPNSPREAVQQFPYENPQLKLAELMANQAEPPVWG